MNTFSRRATVAASLAASAVIAAIVAPAAHATGAVDGAVLRIHSTGSVYAGSGDTVTAVDTPGGTSTYTVEVENKGSVQCQFNLRLNTEVGETLTLSAGSLITTPLALGPSGYYTPAISPGKSLVFTLKAKAATSMNQISRYFNTVALYDTDGNFLDQVNAETEFKATTGPFLDDVYVTGNTGGPLISEPQLFFADYADQPIKSGKAASYSVKVQNDSQTPAALRVSISSFAPCDDEALAPFPLSVKVGTSDVTPAVEAGTYMTATLAHAKSVTFTVSVSYPSPAPAGCTSDQTALVAFGPDNSATEVNMDTLLAAS
jgi:hypothetical protein